MIELKKKIGKIKTNYSEDEGLEEEPKEETADDEMKTEGDEESTEEEL